MRGNQGPSSLKRHSCEVRFRRRWIADGERASARRAAALKIESGCSIKKPTLRAYGRTISAKRKMTISLKCREGVDRDPQMYIGTPLSAVGGRPFLRRRGASSLNATVHKAEDIFGPRSLVRTFGELE